MCFARYFCLSLLLGPGRVGLSFLLLSISSCLDLRLACSIRLGLCFARYFCLSLLLGPGRVGLSFLLLSISSCLDLRLTCSTRLGLRFARYFCLSLLLGPGRVGLRFLLLSISSCLDLRLTCSTRLGLRFARHLGLSLLLSMNCLSLGFLLLSQGGGVSSCLDLCFTGSTCLNFRFADRLGLSLLLGASSLSLNLLLLGQGGRLSSCFRLRLPRGIRLSLLLPGLRQLLLGLNLCLMVGVGLGLLPGRLAQGSLLHPFLSLPSGICLSLLCARLVGLILLTRGVVRTAKTCIRLYSLTSTHIALAAAGGTEEPTDQTARRRAILWPTRA